MNSFGLTLLAIFSGLVLGVSSIYPDSPLGVLAGFISILSFWFFLEGSKKPFLPLYLLGVSFHATSMWWLGGTMERFGGFPWIAARLLLVLYFLASALQFLLSAWMAQKISGRKLLPASFMFSWMILELFFPRLFPWGLGDFFVSVSSFSSYAEYFGSRGLSLLVLVISYAFYRIVLMFFSSGFSHLIPLTGGAVSFAAFLMFGFHLDQSALDREKEAPRMNALVVQGNLDIFQKGSMSFLEANIKTYQNLTRKGLDDNDSIDFVIWPETVMNHWTPVMYPEYPDPRIDPFPGLEVPLLYGTLSYFLSEGSDSSDALRYNGAIVRDGSGLISGHYAKRALMPFGEYVPFGDTFPWVRSLVPLQEDFSRGEVEVPLKIRAGSHFVFAGILICYEDLVSDISREYVLRGADVLINLTNDAWYGDSSAPYQHDLLARFRAIETRRALVRSTNTGLTTSVNSRGQIEDSLPLFEEAYQVFSVPLLQYTTFYVRFGDYPLYCLLFIMGGYLFFARRKGV